MSDQADLSRAEDEASRWFTVLKRTAISVQDLEDFRSWKRQGDNAAAFARVERAWKGAVGLRNDPDVRAARAAAVQTTAPVAKVRWVAVAPLAAGLAAMAVVGAAWLGGYVSPAYSTHIGEQRLVALSDGSKVRLNTNSRLRVRFSSGERRIVLERGEAFFDVAHDPARPFVVEADGASVRALGTKFDVRREAASVQVTLLQGRVQVAQAGQRPAELSPNEQLTASASGISRPHPADAAEASSWTTGQLRFRAVPLSEAVAEMNRYSSRKVVVDGGPSLAAEPVSGVFDVGDVSGFVSALTLSLDLQASSASQGVIRLVPRQASPAA